MLIPYLWPSIDCSVCQEEVESRFLGLCSGLGPPLLICKCSCFVETERREWVDFQKRQRILFIIATAIYAALAFFGGGFATLIWYRFGLEGLDEFAFELTDPAFLTGALISPILILALQRYRISCSKKRKPSVHRETSALHLSFWNLDFNLHLKFVVLWLFIAVLLTALTRFIVK